jgi:hypothetical protein
VASGDQINLRPTFKQTTVPCEGEVGDLFVQTPLQEGEHDHSDQGVASLWFCTKAGRGERPAVWKRVLFEGTGSCESPVPLPPDVPKLEHG